MRRRTQNAGMGGSNMCLGICVASQGKSVVTEVGISVSLCTPETNLEFANRPHSERYFGKPAGWGRPKLRVGEPELPV
jgi:hypothetical protein